MLAAVARHVQQLWSTRRGRLIALVVVAQLVAPLHYYVARRDRHDERFSWRMFSPMRMARCTAALAIDEQPVELTSEFHPAWAEIAQRGRLSVVEAMGQWLCERSTGKPVTIVLQCTYIDREPIRFGGFDLCKVPKI